MKETADLSYCKWGTPDAALERVPGYARQAAEKGWKIFDYSPHG